MMLLTELILTVEEMAPGSVTAWLVVVEIKAKTKKERMIECDYLILLINY